MIDHKMAAFLLRRAAEKNGALSNLLWEAAALIERQTEVDAAARVVCDEWRAVRDQSAIFATTRSDGVRLGQAVDALRTALGEDKP